MPIKTSRPENDCFCPNKNSEPIYFDKIISFKKREGEKRSYEMKYKAHLNSLSFENTTVIEPGGGIILNNLIYFSKSDMNKLIELFK